MTCQRCPAAAAVHVTESVDGQVRELHLCPECAKRFGIPVPTETPTLGLDAILQHLIQSHVGELVGELARQSCPVCGLRFMEFRTAGRLGCPHDYTVFQQGLEPHLSRHHQATRHVGKRPQRRAPHDAPSLECRAALRRAIAREDYELAARLRDQLRRKDS
jgi:protein arginine kinase activator